MGLARNLSKFKPSSDGLVGAEDIAAGAVTAEKIAEGAIPAGSGTNTFTASGSITAGKAVYVNDDGTVSEPTGEYFSSKSFPDVAAASPEGIPVATNGTHVLMITPWYYDPRGAEYGVYPANYLAYKIADSTYSTQSTSTRVGYTNDTYWVRPSYTRLFYDNTNNKFILFYIDQTGSASHALKVNIISVNSSNVITVESSTTIDSTSSSTTYLSPTYFSVASTGNGTYVVSYYLYSTTSANTRMRLKAVTISGSSVTSGSYYEPNVTSSANGGVYYFVNAGKIIFRYYENSTSSDKYAVLTRSGNTLTLLETKTGTGVSGSFYDYYTPSGQKKSHDTTNCNNIGNVLISNLGTSTLTYATISGNEVTSQTANLPIMIDSDPVFVVVGNLICCAFRGNTFYPANAVLYAEFEFNTSNNNVSLLTAPTIILGVQGGSAMTALAASNGNIAGNRFSVAAYNSLFPFSGTVTTTKASKAIGLAKQTVSNGQSVEVTTIGGVNSNNTGLIIGSRLSLTSTGSVTGNQTPVFIGTALSSTNVLVKG